LKTAYSQKEKQHRLRRSRATDHDGAPARSADGTKVMRGFQAAFPDWAAEFDFCVLGDEMGLGKTLQALVACRKRERVLIVVPTSTIYGWQAETACWAGRTPYLVKTRTDTLPSTGWILMPWSLASYYDLTQTWNAVIVDEVHYAKNPEAKRTVAVLGAWNHGVRTPGAVDRADRVICLTGTPIPNRPRELRPLVGAMGVFCCDPFTHLAQNPYAWGNQYCDGHSETIYVRRPGAKKASKVTTYNDGGASRLDELQTQLRTHGMMRRLKSEVLRDLPPIERQVIPVGTLDIPLPVGWTREKLLAVLGEGSVPAFSEISLYRSELGMKKVPIVLDHLVDILEEDPEHAVVLFCHHRAVAEAICDGLALHDITYLLAHGGHDAAARQKMVSMFTEGIGRVFVGTIGATGTGMDGLQHRTDHCVFAELPWVPAELDQAISRLHRMGQEGSVLAQMLVVPETMDAYVIETLLRKESVLTRALDCVTETELNERNEENDGLCESVVGPGGTSSDRRGTHGDREGGHRRITRSQGDRMRLVRDVAYYCE
jgi:SWI/SNF-related matrix-associated actin-dependent regulator of chromatin subfamily A-like protein 1